MRKIFLIVLLTACVTHVGMLSVSAVYHSTNKNDLLNYYGMAAAHHHRPIQIMAEHPQIGAWFGSLALGALSIVGLCWPLKPSTTKMADKLDEEQAKKVT